MGKRIHIQGRKKEGKVSEKMRENNFHRLHFCRFVYLLKFVNHQISTHASDCSHAIKRCLLIGKKAMTNLDSILRSRDVSMLTKIQIVKAVLFVVVMYGYESWTIKNDEHQNIDAFEWCWRRLLIFPWAARTSNQSTLTEINSGYSLKGLMLKPKLQYSGHLMRRANSLEKTLMLVIAYSKRCRICDLQRRFTFGTGDQAWSLKSFRVAEVY